MNRDVTKQLSPTEIAILDRSSPAAGLFALGKRLARAFTRTKALDEFEAAIAFDVVADGDVHLATPFPAAAGYKLKSVRLAFLGSPVGGTAQLSFGYKAIADYTTIPDFGFVENASIVGNPAAPEFPGRVWEVAAHEAPGAGHTFWARIFTASATGGAGGLLIATFVPTE